LRLNALKLTNFRQHPNTEITFSDGLTGIMGPNGAGKTTILEAVAYALYGVTAIRGTKESLKYLGAAPRAPVSVELDFDLAGHRYRVVRSLTSADLFLDAAEAPIASSTTAVNNLLQQRLGMNCGEFFHTYFTGQKELTVMAAMTPLQRGQFLSRVLGYERLREAQDRAREHRRGVEREIAGLKSAMPDVELVTRTLNEAQAKFTESQKSAEEARRRQELSQADVARIEPRWASAQQQREQVWQISAEISLAEQTESSVARDVERIANQLREIEAARAEMKALLDAIEPLDALKAERDILDTLYREDGRRKTLVETETSLGEELETLRKKLGVLAKSAGSESDTVVALDRKRRELEVVTGQLEARRTEWIRDRQQAETKLDELRKQYVDLTKERDRIVALGETGECPTCSRPLGGSMHTVVEHIEEQLETVKVDGAYFSKRFDQLSDAPKDIDAMEEKRRVVNEEVTALERSIAKIQESVRELAVVTREVETKEKRRAQLQFDIARIPLGYDAKRHEVVRAEIEQLLPLEAKCQKVSALPEREPVVRAEYEKASTDLANARGKIAELRALVDKIQFSETEFAALKTEYESLFTSARAAELALATAEEVARGAGAALQSAEAAAQEMQRTQAKLDALNSDRRLHEELDRAFTDLRKDLNYQLRPELSELASAFLTELTDARYSELELDDEYNIVILEDGVTKPVLSGGEEDLANLVLRLAISQMIAERAGQSFSLLILDEVFGSLDELRRFNVIELLRGLQDRFEQVILITHIESVRERVDQVISVKYDEETRASVVTQTDNPGAVTEEDVRLSLELQAAGAE
jgi:DNA repair protein SbcC/Rad50